MLLGKINKAAVTGGAGFIGSHIVEELLRKNVEVISIDNYLAGKKANTDLFDDDKNFTFCEVDITDYDAIEPCLKDVDVMFHNAASKKTVCLKDPMRDLEINAKGTFNMLKAARTNDVKQFVHASTGSVYGEPLYFPTDEQHPTNPTSFYGASKLAAEKYVLLEKELYDTNVTILRYHHVYGPRQDDSDAGGVASIFMRRLHNHLPITIHGDGTQMRSFTYVKDVVNANLFVIDRDECRGEVYNVASGLKVTIDTLADILTEMTRQPLARRIYDEWAIGDIRIFDIDNTKLINLGFEYKTDLEEGLRELYNFYKDVRGVKWG